jgi:hypothetical protein
VIGRKTGNEAVHTAQSQIIFPCVSLIFTASDSASSKFGGPNEICLLHGVATTSVKIDVLFEYVSRSSCLSDADLNRIR